MSEQMISADKVREILINRFMKDDKKIAEIKAMLPTPIPPTLADMSIEKRRACKWMQADTARGRAVVIGPEWVDGHALLLNLEGGTFCWPHASITPRPDLPRLELPGDKKPAPALAPALPDGWKLAEHPDYGRVVVTRPEPDDNGDVVIISSRPWGTCADMIFCKPAEITYIDAEPGADAVPPNTLAEGSEWDKTDALAQACRESGRDQIVVGDKRGIVSVWDAGLQCWSVTALHAGLAPFTILHTGKKADQ